MIETLETKQTLGSNVQPRSAILADLKQIAELEANWCLSDPATYEDFLNFYKTKRLTDHLDVLSTQNHYLKGFIGFSIHEHTRTCHIWNLAVFPEYKKSGVATELILHALKTARDLGCTQVFLEVAESNLAAISLYTKLNFREVGFKNEHYGFGEGCFTYEYTLK